MPSSRWALWAFAAALLLKAAMPLLASASAQVQGKTLVEVCTVYGVALVPLDAQGQEPAPDHTAGHCALTGLMAWAGFDTPALAVEPALRHDAVPPAPRAVFPLPDAHADWAARLRHGPPDRA